MKSGSLGFIRTAVVLLASAIFSFAQTSGYNPRNQTVQAPESVRPGALNYVEGQVSSDGQTLTPQAVGHFALQPGQSLETGNGYAEILLTPGAFLRVGPNSELTIASAGLANTRVNLAHGNAMLEADQVIEGTALQVGLGNNSARVIKKGLYSFDANQQVVRVLDGKLKVVAATKSREIGKDDQIMLANGDNLKKSSFDGGTAKHETLYVWSEARSRDEARQNQVMAANNYSEVGPGNGWFWNPYSNYYGFWPSSAFLYSPFGFGFYGYPGIYGYYPGFYGGFYGYRGYHGYRSGVVGGVHAYSGFHSNYAGGGFHGGGGGRR